MVISPSTSYLCDPHLGDSGKHVSMERQVDLDLSRWLVSFNPLEYIMWRVISRTVTWSCSSVWEARWRWGSVNKRCARSLFPRRRPPTGGAPSPLLRAGLRLRPCRFRRWSSILVSRSRSARLATGPPCPRRESIPMSASSSPRSTGIASPYNGVSEIPNPYPNPDPNSFLSCLGLMDSVAMLGLHEMVNWTAVLGFFFFFFSFGADFLSIEETYFVCFICSWIDPLVFILWRVSWTMVSFLASSCFRFLFTVDNISIWRRFDL